MSYWGWKPYVPAAARRKKAEAAAARARKSGAALAPVVPSRGAIARTFWGKAWCENLEQYSDYANRLPRGRTYVRNGSVIDLAIAEGEVRAQVVGSDLYRVEVRVAAVGDRHWKAIGADCAGSIDSMVELLQGRFSQAVMQRLCRPGDGLFPAPREIHFSCSCPDWASMCKHVAAVLYGVGARLDSQPELLFRLRRVDGADLLAQADQALATPATRPAQGRRLDAVELAEMFDIEMTETAPAPGNAETAKKPPPGRRRAAAGKIAPQAAGAARKTGAASSAAAAEPKRGHRAGRKAKAGAGVSSAPKASRATRAPRAPKTPTEAEPGADPKTRSKGRAGTAIKAKVRIKPRT
ncbi:MAG: hypothetical protein AMXMBFR66_25650 [Pseudomonadota bacterium]|nr:hypothetical protein [Rubrivivax sp.]